MEERCPKGTRDNRASQLNPSRPAYYQLRGSSPQGAERSAYRSVDGTRTVPANRNVSNRMIANFPLAQSKRRVVSKRLSK